MHYSTILAAGISLLSLYAEAASRPSSRTSSHSTVHSSSHSSSHSSLRSVSHSSSHLSSHSTSLHRLKNATTTVPGLVPGFGTGVPIITSNSSTLHGSESRTPKTTKTSKSKTTKSSSESGVESHTTTPRGFNTTTEPIKSSTSMSTTDRGHNITSISETSKTKSTTSSKSDDPNTSKSRSSPAVTSSSTRDHNTTSSSNTTTPLTIGSIPIPVNTTTSHDITSSSTSEKTTKSTTSSTTKEPESSSKSTSSSKSESDSTTSKSKTTSDKGSSSSGTKTDSSTTKSTNAPPVTTFSELPKSISTSATSAPSNTHDSKGNPILGPWPGCWFCPPDSHGIALFGFLPGIYPPGPPPPGFPTPFPALTIGPGGDPTFPPSPTPTPTTPKSTGTKSTSSESCTKTLTVTDTTIYVSFELDSKSSTTKTSTYSTGTSVITGCSVTGTKTTSTKTATCSTDCCAWRYVPTGDGDDGVDGDSTDTGTDDFTGPSLTTGASASTASPAAKAQTQQSKKTASPSLQGIAGRLKLDRRIPSAESQPESTPAPLLPRAKGAKGRTYTEFGNCQFPAGSSIVENPFPRVKDFAKFKGTVSAFWVVTQAACPAPATITSTSDFSAASVSAGGPPYQSVQPGKGQKTPWVNSDHVYELSILKTFFEFMLSRPTNPVSCTDFNNFFWQNDHLAKIYEYMPGNQFPDFAFMDANVNNKKADYFDGLNFLDPTKIKKNLNAIAEYGMAADFVNDKEILHLYQTTHQRMYQAFKGLDDAITCNTPTGLTAEWAEAYADWMDSFLQKIGTDAKANAGTMYTNLKAQFAGNNGQNPANLASLNAISAVYSEDRFVFNTASMASLDKAQAANPVKRAGTACSAKPTSVSASTTKSSASVPSSIQSPKGSSTLVTSGTKPSPSPTASTSLSTPSSAQPPPPPPPTTTQAPSTTSVTLPLSTVCSTTTSLSRYALICGGRAGCTFLSTSTITTSVCSVV